MGRKSSFALAGLLLLAGCGKAPKGQVVAIVNGQEISIQQLAAEVQDMPIPDSIDRAVLRKAVLQGIIDRELQVEEARKLGLDKSPRYLAMKSRNDEELLASMLGHRLAQTVPLPIERDIQAYIESHPLQFTRRQRLLLDQLSFVPPKDRRRLAVLANTHNLDEAATALQSIGIISARGQSAIDTAQADPAIAVQLDRLPSGETVLLPQGDRLIVGTITGREPIAGSSDDMKLAAARAVRAAALLRESQAQIAAARGEAHIEYEPGFEPDKAVTAARRR